jgi:hypothetical protein
VGAKKGLEANENCGIIVVKFSVLSARYRIVSRNDVLGFEVALGQQAGGLLWR